MKEVIVVDDCSTDNATEGGLRWWKEFEKKQDFKVTSISTPENLNFLRASNLGLSDTVSRCQSDDIIVLLAYIDCDLNIKDTAAYLHEQRTNMYHIIQRIREKVRMFYPDLRPAKHKGSPQPGQRKTSGFGINYNGLEYLDYDEWHPALYDRKPQTLRHDLHTIGLVPGSSPTKHHLSEAVYDAVWHIQDQRPLDTRLARQQRPSTPGPA